MIYSEEDLRKLTALSQDLAQFINKYALTPRGPLPEEFVGTSAAHVADFTGNKVPPLHISDFYNFRKGFDAHAVRIAQHSLVSMANSYANNGLLFAPSVVDLTLVIDRIAYAYASMWEFAVSARDPHLKSVPILEKMAEVLLTPFLTKSSEPVQDVLVFLEHPDVEMLFLGTKKLYFQCVKAQGFVSSQKDMLGLVPERYSPHFQHVRRDNTTPAILEAAMTLSNDGVSITDALDTAFALES